MQRRGYARADTFAVLAFDGQLPSGSPGARARGGVRGTWCAVPGGLYPQKPCDVLVLLYTGWALLVQRDTTRDTTGTRRAGAGARRCRDR